MSTPTWGPDRPDHDAAGPAPDGTGPAPADAATTAPGAYPPPSAPSPGTGHLAPPSAPYAAPGSAYPTTAAPTGAYPSAYPTDPYRTDPHATGPHATIPEGSYPGAPSGSYPGSPTGSYPGSPAGSYPGSPAGSSPGAYSGTPAGTYPGASPSGSSPASPYGGYAPGAYPGGPGWAGPVQPRTDGMAIASLAVSGGSILVSGLAAPVGVGLGIAALRRIRRTGADGRGLAIAGIAVGSVITAAMIAFVVFLFAVAGFATFGAATSSSTTDSWGAPGTQDDPWPGSGDDADTADSSTLPPYELLVQLTAGECLDVHPDRYDMSDASPVDCGTTHGSEVVSAIPLTAPVSEDLFGSDPVFTAAYDTCTQQIEALLGGAVTTVGVPDLYYPHPDQWDAGGRTAYCVLAPDAPVTGSLVSGTLAPGATSGV